MAYAKDEDTYERLYNTLLSKDHTAVNRYFQANWHDIREQWVEGLKKKQFNFLTSTNNRVECINQKLKSVISKYSNIVTFFKDLKTALKMLETERNHRTLSITQKSSVHQLPAGSPEAKYKEFLTPYACK